MTRRSLLALLFLPAACAHSPSPAPLRAETERVLVGTWEQSTPMGESEGGACTLAFTTSDVTMKCSPGSRTETASFRVTACTADAVTIATATVPPASYTVRFGRVDDRRVIEIDGQILGAYGNERRWSAVSVAGAPIACP